MRVVFLKHVDREGPGLLEEFARAGGHRVEILSPYRGDRLADPERTDAIVSLGGPQSANDAPKESALAYEIKFLRDARHRGTAILGICLGAQLIAKAFGAKITKGVPELGWAPVALTPEGIVSPLFRDVPAAPEVFHWHAETFDLPPGAKPLAWTGVCPNQAFSIGEAVFGIQFHIELTPAMVEEMCAAAPKDLKWTDPPSDPVVLRRITTEHFAESRLLAKRVFANFLELAGGRRTS